MPTLLPCPSCDRHVRVADAVCPFCQEAMPCPAGPERVSAARKIAQAALLAGSLAGSAACTGGSDDKVDASQQANIDAQPGQADAGATSDANTNRPDGMPPMPYGAPPARRRLV